MIAIKLDNEEEKTSLIKNKVIKYIQEFDNAHCVQFVR